MEPLISVIVPVYNVENYLEKCLQSLVKQTIPLKIIVINDGSSDNSEKIISKFINEYSNILYIKKENGGIADVRNVGLANVTTKYFGFLDSDDYIESTMYEDMLKKAIENDSDLVVCQFYWEELNGSKKIGYDGPYLPKKDMLVKLMATLWNKLYKTETIKAINVKFPTGYRYEDAYFLYAITPFINKISFIETPYVHYIQREGSITHNHNEKVKDMIHVFESLLSFYRDNNMYDLYFDELEYLFTKFFLGNSFLRTVQIEDKKIRNETLDMSINLLVNNFPNYQQNRYLVELKGLKNKYFKLVDKNNYKFFAYLFMLKEKLCRLN